MKSVWGDRIFSRSSSRSVFCKNSYSEDLWKIHRKATPAGSFYNKFADFLT